MTSKVPLKVGRRVRGSKVNGEDITPKVEERPQEMYIIEQSVFFFFKERVVNRVKSSKEIKKDGGECNLLVLARGWSLGTLC